MDTNEYFEYQIKVLNKCTDNFIYDEKGADYNFKFNDDLNQQVIEFLDYYASILGDNKVFIPDNNNKDLFEITQGQKLYEIISNNCNFKNSFSGKLKKKYVYEFLHRVIFDVDPDDEEENLDTISRWFSQGKKPNRKTIFKISFGLNLPIDPPDDNPNYCHKALFNKVFCERYALRVPDELCFMYAKYHKKTYKEALDIYQRFLSEIEKNHSHDNNALLAPKDTIAILSKTENIFMDEEQFVKLLVSYYPYLNIQYTTAFSKLNEYKKIIEKDDFTDAVLSKRHNIFEFIFSDIYHQLNDEEVRKQTYRNTDELMTRLKRYIRYGCIDERETRADLHNIFDFVIKKSDYYVKPENMSNSTFYSKVRKALIYFHFLTYWINLDNSFSPDYDDYIQEINELLDKCMLPQLYPFNRADLFYTYCSRSNDPISTFFILLSRMDDVIDENY